MTEQLEHDREMAADPQAGEHAFDDSAAGEFDVAIIGMSGRFPGADDVDAFWSNLRAGRDAITRFSEDDLRAAGVPDELLRNPHYVRASGKLRDVQHFDAGFFGYSPREAELLEPGHRIFLECAWEALEDAGYVPEAVRGRVGVYAGAGSSGYTEQHLLPNAALMASIGGLQANLAGGKDFLATRTSYKLDLRGPSVNVQTACSTSLVAVHLAVQSLLGGESDLALAGGASVLIPQDSGYMYSPGGVVSPDGSCRAFDARSAGPLSGSGVGVVVLKRLADAVRDGDPVRAVIKGSAINNDGAAKVAYTAPGVEGQATVITEAIAAAGVEPDTIGYVEAHGTGTDLGDTIEIAALTRAFRASTDRTGYCAVGSVKTSIGHLDTAAGVAGLIKTVLALEHREIPPTTHFETPNPKIDFASSPFHVAARLEPWKADGHPRRAGVSSFGIGGTNAHLVLEEVPEPEPSGPSRPWQLLTLSARGPRALDEAARRLADHLAAHPELPLADVAFTLREGRRAFPHRRTLAVRAGEDAAALLRGSVPERIAGGVVEGGSRTVAFLFPGLGDHYPNMARGLYEAERVFRAEVDRCAEILRPRLGLDLREVLFPGDAPSDAPAGGVDLRAMLGRSAQPDAAAERLNRTELAQPAVFVVDYALAKLWMSWGIVPDAVIGHSLGEYAAACIAGVLSLEDALALVADRARMIQELPGGAMLAVSLDESAVRPLLTPELAIATVNAPGLTVVSGPEDAVAALQGRLAEHGHVARRLATTHAFHSPMMQPVAGRLAERAAAVKLSPPRIPMISNVTGTWLTDQEATDPAYWTRHLLGTVRFAQGVAELLAEPGRVLLEVGPGQTLSTFVRQRPEGGPAPAAVVPSLRYAYDRTPDPQFLVDALGRLWIAGVSPDWKAFRAGERRRRVRLPTYPWERQRYWIEAPRYDDEPEPAQPARAARSDAVSTGTLAWTRAPLPAAPESPPRRVLLLGDGGDAFHALASALERAGHAVTAVRPGDGFGGGGGAYTLRLDARDDYRALADVLARDDAWPDAAVHAVAGEAGFASVLLLAAALGGAGREIDLLLAAPVGGEITGGEPLSPHAAAVIGTSLLVPLQFPSLRCRVVALPGGELPPALADRVAEEVAAGADEPLVAYRGGERWARGVRGGAAGAVASASPESAGKLYERPEQDTEYHAPTNETEERIAALWQELLGIERIGIHDDFFALGGHSLLATQIVARVRDMFQLELPLQAIFEAPTVARFAALVEEAIIAELEAMNEDEAAGLIG